MTKYRKKYRMSPAKWKRRKREATCRKKFPHEDILSAAREFIRLTSVAKPQAQMSLFECPVCNKLHLGHQGRLTRKEYSILREDAIYRMARKANYVRGSSVG